MHVHMETIFKVLFYYRYFAGLHLARGVFAPIEKHFTSGK